MRFRYCTTTVTLAFAVIFSFAFAPLPVAEAEEGTDDGTNATLSAGANGVTSGDIDGADDDRLKYIEDCPSCRPVNGTCDISTKDLDISVHMHLNLPATEIDAAEEGDVCSVSHNVPNEGFVSLGVYIITVVSRDPMAHKVVVTNGRSYRRLVVIPT